MITNDSIQDHEHARVSPTRVLSTTCLMVSQRVYTSHLRDQELRRAGEYHHIGTKMMNLIYVLPHMCAMLGACASLHTSGLLYIPRIGPARHHCNCTCPLEIQARRTRHRRQRLCHCWARRHNQWVPQRCTPGDNPYTRRRLRCRHSDRQSGHLVYLRYKRMRAVAYTRCIALFVLLRAQHCLAVRMRWISLSPFHPRAQARFDTYIHERDLHRHAYIPDVGMHMHTPTDI